ncbi:S8 family serine peptidase [Phenylobacterium sp.]|uniref:S8 family serine peptidase n=1 Tax=Phenylobacterium sp. TaxID=1871053 RepID=UPI0025E73EF0|nr:S8 family serine peptidase [Phenylobacterium sp.]
MTDSTQAYAMFAGGPAPEPDGEVVIELVFGAARDLADVQAALAAALPGAAFKVEPVFDPARDRFFFVTFPDLSIDGREPAGFALARALRAELKAKEANLAPRDSLYGAQMLGVEGAALLGGLCSTPDTKYPKGWSQAVLAVQQAWDAAPTGRKQGEGVKVALIDTGSSNHAEVDGVYLRELGANLVEHNTDPDDRFSSDVLLANPGHGTLVSSVIASRGGLGSNQGTTGPGSVTGVAPASKLVPIRSIRSVVDLNQSRIPAAILHAIASGCDVIVMCLGGPSRVASVEAALRKAVDAGLVVVCAAGNCYPFVVFPAAYAQDRLCAAVAAVGHELKPWAKSARGPAVTVSAPGEDVWGARLRKANGNLTAVAPSQGTTLATSNTAGVAALWVAHHGGRAALLKIAKSRNLTVQELFLRAIVSDITPPAVWNGAHDLGAGVVNAAKTLAYDLTGATAVAAGAELAAPKAGKAVTPTVDILRRHVAAYDQAAAAEVDDSLSDVAAELIWRSFRRGAADRAIEAGAAAADLAGPPPSVAPVELANRPNLRAFVEGASVLDNAPTGPGRPRLGGQNLDDMLAGAHDSARGLLADGRSLREFLNDLDELTPDGQRDIVDQAICLLENFYAHLPFKRAMHAIDPLQRLRLLRRRIDDLPNEAEFHKELIETFTSLRDLHTNYMLPGSYQRAVANLPFRVRYCVEGGQRKYVVTQVLSSLNHPTFRPGVELTYWNGMPIERAVELVGGYHAGSNPAARHARGVDGLTFRYLGMSLPPDEEWVVVGYKDAAGNPQEFRTDWIITGLPQGGLHGEAPTPAANRAAIGLDLEGDMRRRVFAKLYAPAVSETRQRIDEAVAASGAADTTSAAIAAAGDTQSIMPEVFRAQTIDSGGRTYGYLRIWTFNVPDADAFVREAQRLVALLPQDGLVLDVQGNGGGLIWAGERLLQLFTPRRIEPTRAQFIVSPLTTSICRKGSQFAAWGPSMERAVTTGSAFSSAFPITDPDTCNLIGQTYHGPVVLITDARCYSTTDMFAAGFRDHDVGEILGVDDNMGAGGANVWDMDAVRYFLPRNGVPPALKPLDGGLSMRVAIRRTLRVGAEAGTEIEDLGVRPTKVHQPTRRDLLEGDKDLLAAACDMLKRRPAYRLTATPPVAGAGAALDIQAAGLAIVDVYVDGRPAASLDVAGGAARANLALAHGARIELKGFDAAGALVAGRRLSVA